MIYTGLLVTAPERDDDPAAARLDETDDVAVSDDDAAGHGDELAGQDDTDGEPK